jgi:hypothetical protein
LLARPHEREACGDRPFAAADERGRGAVRRDDPRSRDCAERSTRTLLNLYNAKGVFNNREDDIASLSDGLRQRFDRVEIERRGCAALFRAA